MWQTIYEANQKDYIMTATCNQAVYGLTAGHAYTLYSAVMVDDDGKQVKLVQVRNPWGLEGYTGEWNDKDPRWTADLREKLGANDKNDGFFFMPFKVFKEAFSAYQVTQYSDQWQTSFKKGTGQPGKYFQYFFENKVDQEFVISFDQTPPSSVPAGCDLPKVNYNLLVYDESGQKIRHKGVAPQTNFGQVHFKSLPQGNYKFVVINFGDITAPSDFGLTVYGLKQKVGLYAPADFMMRDLEEGEKKESTSGGYKLKYNFDQAKQTLTISTERLPGATEKEGKIEAEIFTPAGAPWQVLKANFDWTQNVKAQVVTYKKGTHIEQFYRVTFTCPEKMN